MAGTGINYAFDAHGGSVTTSTDGSTFTAMGSAPGTILTFVNDNDGVAFDLRRKGDTEHVPILGSSSLTISGFGDDIGNLEVKRSDDGTDATTLRFWRQVSC